MFKIKEHRQYCKDLEDIKRGCKKSVFDKILNRIQEFCTYKVKNIPLPFYFKDHDLYNTGKFQNCRECYLRHDIVLVYKVEHSRLILNMLKIENDIKVLEKVKVYSPNDEGGMSL